MGLGPYTQYVPWHERGCFFVWFTFMVANKLSKMGNRYICGKKSCVKGIRQLSVGFIKWVSDTFVGKKAVA